ncbi:MAG: YjbQ family protein [bacterium]|nr:YjbQ family protein [bacterium]
MVRLRTRRGQHFIDITELVHQHVRRSGLTEGIVNIQTRHTTTGVILNENEPLLLQDLERLFEQWAPRDAEYKHDDLRARRPPLPPDEPRNGHAHARAVVLGSSESVNVLGGRLMLGRWQSIFFVELDGPREREISIAVMGIANGPVTARAVLETTRHAGLRGVS